MSRNDRATSRHDTSAGLALGSSKVAYVTLIDRGRGMINGRVYHIGYTNDNGRTGSRSDRLKGPRQKGEDITR